MKEVSKEEFYKIIEEEKLDVCPNSIGNHPFTCEFKFRNGTIWGKIVPTEVDNKKYPEYPWYKEHYYIM